jgi:ribosomal protein S18 acetylase RimI-like enzyme
MAITLRDASENDAAFLLEVYGSTRADELAVVPWTDEQKDAFLTFQFNAQHSSYQERYPEASYQIILQDNVPIGRLYVLREANEIRILDITLLPQHRNSGVGSTLIRQLLVEGEQTNRPVDIWVEHFNPSMRLFQRLGFCKVQEDGFNCLMEWREEPGNPQITQI